jgi:hypothetical protein
MILIYKRSFMQRKHHHFRNRILRGILSLHPLPEAILFVFASWLSLVSFSQPVNNVSPKTLALFNAIRSGSSQQLQQQLDNGASANDSLNSYSALMAAALKRSVDHMKY